MIFIQYHDWRFSDAYCFPLQCLIPILIISFKIDAEIRSTVLHSFYHRKSIWNCQNWTDRQIRVSLRLLRPTCNLSGIFVEIQNDTMTKTLWMRFSIFSWLSISFLPRKHQLYSLLLNRAHFLFLYTHVKTCWILVNERLKMRCL